MPLEGQTTATAEGRIAMKKPLRVKNLEGNATVFSKMIDGNSIRIQFAANGYPGDTQRVPLSLVDDIDFLNSLEAGVLEVVDGPDEVKEALQFETAQVRAEREAESERFANVLDRRQDRDMVGVTCIGPAPGGREGNCGRSILQTAKQQGEQPPLCSQHQHLAPNYYLAESGSKGRGATETSDGVVRREWREVTMTDRQRSTQQ